MEMRIVLVVFTVVAAGAAKSLPNINDLDTEIVESTVREVRAVVPDTLRDLVDKDTKKAFLHTYGDAEDNEQGFEKRSDDEGAKGYKHYDSFHKKDGDKYGFEAHSAFGKEDAASAEAGEKSAKYSQEENDKESEADKEDADGDEDETKHSYQVVENIDEDSGDYTEGGGDSEDYTDAEHNEHTSEGDFGGYGIDGGSAGHYTDGSSGYTYGSDGGAEEGDGGSEHYTAAEDYDDD